MSDTPQLQFDKSTHTYTVNGEVYPSVTQIIKEAGLIDDVWFNEEATDRGTIVHAATSLCDIGRLNAEAVPNDVQPYLDGWKRFLQENKPQIVGVERRFYQPTYCFAGTIDRLLFVGGVKAILDIKSGAPQAWHEIQTAGYGLGVGMSGARYCLYLDGKGGYKLERHEGITGRDIFMAALNLYHYKQSKGLLCKS